MANPRVPFIYGRPVKSIEFLNRGPELRTAFNRLRNGESTAIVGEPHIGKSSLLLKLAESETQRIYLGGEAQRITVSILDLQSVANDYTPAAFWLEALDPLRRSNQAELGLQLQQAADLGYARRSLERLFNYLGQTGGRLVLLLDEFERLLAHPQFQDSAFFGLLRSLSTRTGGLAWVTTSRLSVTQMNELGHGLLATGSPFFNNVIEVRLHPFDDRVVGMLLDRAGDILSSDERRFVRRVAGRHPFLLQAMVATMLEMTGDDRQARAAESFYERISFHFDDLWRTLDDHTRTAAVILGLVELGGRALGHDFAFGEIERVDSFGPELRNLAERGLAERVGEEWQFDQQHLLLWRGERWTVGCQAFAWWVRDVVIAESRLVPSYTEWLANKRYRFLLTQQQWNNLITLTRRLPPWAVRGVTELAKALFQELLTGKRV
jgi:hypothetical protein